MGSLRRECLDHLLILSTSRLHQIVLEYMTYFNRSRLHQGIEQPILEPKDAQPTEIIASSKIIGHPILGDLHHDYHRVA